ncbi:hypothetical protein WA158_006617 [Blastocystis sp. Blastoise]
MSKLIQSLLLILFVSLTSADSFFSSLLYEEVPNHFCSRTYYRDGAFGCHTPNNGVRGALVPVSKPEDVTALSTLGLSAVTAVLHRKLYTNDTLTILYNMDNVVGIIVSNSGTSSGYSPIPPTPHGNDTPDVSIALHPDYIWQPSGSSLLYIDKQMPIYYIYDSKLDHDLWMKATKNINDISRAQLYYADMMMYMGPETMNSVQCIQKNACTPIGGQSVIGSRGDLSTSDEIYIYAVAQDTIGDIYTYTKGGAEVGANIAILLAIIEQLQTYEIPANRTVLFALFQGEQWGGIGSIKYFTDIYNYKCNNEIPKERNNLGKNICISPLKLYILYTDFSKIDPQRVTYVMVFDQLYPTYIGSLFLHHESDASPVITERILNVAKKLQSYVNLYNSTILPPSSGSYIYKYTDIKNVYTVTGFDKTYYNKNTNSEWDILSEYTYRMISHICDYLLSFIAVDAYNQSSTNSYVCNTTSLTHFLNCFSNTGNCSFISTYMNIPITTLNSIFDGDVTPKYPGVYSIGRQPYATIDGEFSVNYPQNTSSDVSITFSPSVLELFYYYFMTYHLANSTVIRQDCSVDGVCPVGSDCIRGECFESTVSFHDAIDIGFIPDPYPGQFSINTSISTPLYTEPYWGGFYGDEPSLIIYQALNPYVEWVMFIISIVICICTYYLCRYVVSRLGTKLKID